MFKVYHFLAFLLSFSFNYGASSLEIRQITNPVQCGGPDGSLLEVQFTSCSNEPCLVEPGNLHDYQVAFSSDKNYFDAHVKIDLITPEGFPLTMLSQLMGIELSENVQYAIATPDIQFDSIFSGASFHLRKEIRGNDQLGDLITCSIISIEVL